MRLSRFSPIALTHDLDHLCPDVDWVEDYDKYLLAIMDAMIVVKLPGWGHIDRHQKGIEFSVFEHSIPYAYGETRKTFLRRAEIFLEVVSKTVTSLPAKRGI